MILYLIYGFGMVTCTVSPLSRFTAHLLPVYRATQTFVTDISASTGRNDFIFDIWLLHGDLYRVSPFQVYRTSTSDIYKFDTNERVGVFLLSFINIQ
jgi:hypothetical protein